MDLDGWGAGEGLLFCAADVPPNWVDNNEDADDTIYCVSNTIDDCGICDGENMDDGLGFVTGPDADCMGECFGTSIEDECGVCNGNGSSCNTPVAISQTIIVDEDVPLDFILNASDPTEDPLTVIVIQAPSHGTMTVVDGLNLNYSPNAEYSGGDIFKYKVTDDIWTSSTATVTILIAPVNDPPVAQSSSYTVIEDHSVITTMSATDVDNNNASLSFNIESDPSNGTLNLGRAL